MNALKTLWQASTSYRIIESVGEGASSQVFRAERFDRSLDLCQTVALKVLRSENAVDIWRKEFQSLVQVKSPYCVQVFAFESYQNHPALVLEHVDGLNLKELVQFGRLSTGDCQEIMAQAQQGLLDLKMFGLSHGDLSPKNVMVDTYGRVRLLDFGLANLACLTPGFAAPEILHGENSSFATDLFSLGMLGRFLARHGRFSEDVLPLQTLIEENPFARLPHKLKVCDERQAHLAEAVRLAMEMRESLSSLKTKTVSLIKQVRQLPWRVHLLVLAATFAFTSSSQTIPSPSLMASIKIRTLNWHYIYVDGQPIGYTPLELNYLTQARHEIRWTSGRGTGKLVVDLKKSPALKLTDADLVE